MCTLCHLCREYIVTCIVAASSVKHCHILLMCTLCFGVREYIATFTVAASGVKQLRLTLSPKPTLGECSNSGMSIGQIVDKICDCC